MISIPGDFLRQVEVAAEAAYPRECCGLFAGIQNGDGTIAVTRMRTSPNRADDKRPDRFEIDPKVRFDLMRDIGEFDRLDRMDDDDRDTPYERVVGHYHSHPDHPATPSRFDLEMAFEPDLFWLIVAVEKGRATATTIHRLDQSHQKFVQTAFTAV